MARRFRHQQEGIHRVPAGRPDGSDPGYETLVRSVDGIVWEALPESFRFTFVSPQAERILGYPVESWLDDPGFWIDHILPADREWVAGYCKRATVETRNHQFEYRMRHADGSIVWLRDIVTVVVEDGRPVRLCGVMVDVTEQKETDEELRRTQLELETRISRRTAELARANAELRHEVRDHENAVRALQESEARFRTLAENIRQVFWMSTPGAAQLIYVSPAYEEIWGRPLSAVLDNPLSWTEAIHPDDRPRVMEQLRAHAEGRYEVDYRIVRPDGSQRWIHDRGFPVQGEDGELIYMTGIAEDITERRAAEEMERLRDLAAHLQSAREEERTRIAHRINEDLAQDLAGLKLEAGWAARCVTDQPERVRERLYELLETIDGTIDALRTITTDLRPNVLDAGLAEAIRWQASEFERLTKISCSLELPGEPLDEDVERSTALFRIAQEALTNIGRHSGARWVRLSLRREPGALVLEIADDGRGVTAAQLSQGGAFGVLGMQERARLAGGTVTVDGAPGEGTTVRVRMPYGGDDR